MSSASPRLVVVEGIMGSGKSTTVRYIASALDRAGRRAHAITELTRPHPVRGTDGLPHWFRPWIDVTPAALAERCLAKWRRFVDATLADDTVPVVDGQFFHGDLTNLFLMEAGSTALVGYTDALEAVVRPLAPLLIYFYQDDVAQAIRTIAGHRGPEWVKYQVDWKLDAPYSRRRGLSGLEGLIALYEDYRALTDELYARLDVAKLAIETSAQDWPTYYRRIRRTMLPPDVQQEPP